MVKLSKSMSGLIFVAEGAKNSKAAIFRQKLLFVDHFSMLKASYDTFDILENNY